MRRLATLAVGFAIVALELVSVWLWARAGWAPPGYVFMRGPIPMAALLVALAAQGAGGLILVVRRPGNRVGWLIVTFSIVLGVSTVALTASASDPRAMASGSMAWVAWAGTAILFPATSFMGFVLAFFFPDGRLHSPRWGGLLLVVVAACAAAGFLMAIRPGSLLLFPMIANPLLDGGGTAALSRAAGSWLTFGPLLLLAAAGLVGAIALLARYAATTGVVRVQIRWYIATGVLLAVAYSAQLTALALLGPRDPAGETIETLHHLTIALPPIAMTMAILRYRLYDIDTILSRAFVYGALTAVLAGLYAAGIRLFNAIFSEVTGDTSDISLVLTTLLLATTFTPIKGRLERFAGRRLRQAPANSSAAQEAAASSSAAPEAPGAMPAGTSQASSAAPAEMASLDALLTDPRLTALIDARISRSAGSSTPLMNRRPTRSTRRTTAQSGH